MHDVLVLRGVSHVFRDVANAILPLIARRMLSDRVKDKHIADSLYAEALIAAHKLNVSSPFKILVARDGSDKRFDPKTIDAPQSSGTTHRSITRGKSKAKGHSLKSKQKGKAKEAPPEQPLVNLPTRAEWMVGSRRMLHTQHVNGRPWPFGLCSTCKKGTCKTCLELETDVSFPEEAWWRTSSGPRKRSEKYSNAIFAQDAMFCDGCMDEQGERCRDGFEKCRRSHG